MHAHSRNRRTLLATFMSGAVLLTETTGHRHLPFGAREVLARRGGAGKHAGHGNGKGNGKKKVKLCHRGRTIRVAGSSLRRHLSHGDSSGPCPPPDAPPARGPGSCAHNGTSHGSSGSLRYAQTFLAPGTSVSAAEIGLRSNPAGFTLYFDIRTVDAAEVPANTILAFASVRNIDETSSGDPRMVSATFDPPAELQLGETYALVVTGSSNFGIFNNLDSNSCRDGAMYWDNQATGNFDQPFGEADDLIYTLTVP